MKEKLKYIIALIIALTIGVAFMPVVSFGDYRLSVISILKIGFGYNDTSESVLESIFSIIQQYVQNYAYYVLIILVFIVAGAILTAALTGMMSYVMSIFSQVVVNVLTVYMCIQIKNKLYMLEDGVRFFGMEKVVQIHKAPVVVWIVLYTFAMFLSIYGLVIFGKAPIRQQRTDILPESFHSNENPWSSKHNIETQEKMYLAQIQKINREEQRQQKVTNEESFYEKRVVTKGKDCLNLSSLGEKKKSYFINRNNQIRLVDTSSAECMASVYFLSEKQEYCLMPYEYRTVFLDSGQPLGKGREYHLKKGVEIYVCSRENMFVLN